MDSLWRAYTAGCWWWQSTRICWLPRDWLVATWFLISKWISQEKHVLSQAYKLQWHLQQCLTQVMFPKTTFALHSWLQPWMILISCRWISIVKNASIPESTLGKKHNAINYHAACEAVAAGILRVGKEDGQQILLTYLLRCLQVRSDGTFAGMSCGDPLPRFSTSVDEVYFPNRLGSWWLSPLGLYVLCFTSHGEDVLLRVESLSMSTRTDRTNCDVMGYFRDVVYKWRVIGRCSREAHLLQYLTIYLDYSSLLSLL